MPGVPGSAGRCCGAGRTGINNTVKFGMFGVCGMRHFEVSMTHLNLHDADVEIQASASNIIESNCI